MKPGLELSIDGRAMLFRPVDGDVVSVGRNPECDLCVPDEHVAPIQCLLRHDDQGLTLLNRAPLGTWVCGQRVDDTQRLADGDVIALGNVMCTVRFSAERPARVSGSTRTLETHAHEPERALYLTLPEVFPGKRFLLDAAGISIGTDDANTVVVSDPYVSAFHVRFHLDHGRCWVRDVGSRNGVFVGELKTVEAEVPLGAQVRFGQTVAMVAEGSGAARNPRATTAMIGSSEPMKRLRHLIRRVASNAAPVLVTGETGTGKEVVAQMLADLSPRAAKPFIALNCGSLGQNLIESELFGHERGAFTGAVGRKIGAFEAADGGTLFLDEVGELPLELQPQLLRVLETGEVRRVGSAQSFKVDVRLIAATNRRLEREVIAGTFREDLFHRLHVLTVALMPLRERLSDVEELARHFVDLYAPAVDTLELSAAAQKKLASYSWPGNVRELRNVIQRAVLMRLGDVIDADDITFTPSTLRSLVETGVALTGKTLQQIEREAIVAQLRRFAGNKSEAAMALGVSRATVHRKIEEYGIERDELVA